MSLIKDLKQKEYFCLQCKEKINISKFIGKKKIFFRCFNCGKEMVYEEKVKRYFINIKNNNKEELKGISSRGNNIVERDGKLILIIKNKEDGK